MQRVERSIRVAAPVEEVYRFWRNFENFPQFMEHVQEVRLLDTEGRRSMWRLKGPLGQTVEYEAELTQDQPNRAIAWNSTRGSMQTTGAVTFTELQGGGQAPQYTEVHVVIQYYDTPGGAVGEAVSRIFADPEQMLEEDLQRFKNLIESRAGAGFGMRTGTEPTP
jgi:uncharacterized membrane protein